MIRPDGSTTAYLYQGNTVTVTDPAGKWKIFTTDAFGNLVSVQEPDPTLNTTVTTSYTYDILNHLTVVSMPRGTTYGTQTRTFNYNNGNTVTAFLQSAYNPENGTVTYTYNSGTNTLHSKTDAKGQQLTYQYDSYNRLTSVTGPSPYGSGTQVYRTYYYDTNPLDSTGFSQNIQGRLAAVNYPAQSGVQMNEMYSYTLAGLPAAKRLQVNQTATVNLDSTYTYNTEGQITGMTYPNGGPSYNYSYDSMYRLSGMTDSSNNTIVNGVSYNAANQMLGMTFNTEVETRGYNSLNQLITLSVGAFENITYTYPQGANNGKIQSMSDTISGENVAYTYDTLNRLLTAGGNGWGQSYVYDPFGNLLQKNITAGSGPSLNQAVSTNNQIVGQTYDANGNTMYVTNAGVNYNLYYDAENRLSSVYFSPQGLYLEHYAYDAQNRRIWSWPGTLNGSNTSNYTVNFYSPSGQKLGAYLFVAYTSSMGVTLSSSDQYFGSRRLATLDRLGSAGQWGIDKGIYFPWGEAKGTPNPQDTWNYATYWQDSATGLDYANNRYYSNAYGRFTTPDPSTSSQDPRNPQSWNRYPYVLGDPVNANDPTGLEEDETDDGGGGGSDDGGGGVILPTSVNYTSSDITGYDASGNPVVGDANTSTSVTVTAGTSSTSTSDSSSEGWGWGVTYGGVVGGGIGQNWSFGGSASVLAGNFHCGGHSGIGGAASAGAFAAGSGSHTSYPTNNSNVPNSAWGVMAGRGPGMFWTNTGDTAQLRGPFTSVIIALPAWLVGPGFQIEYDYSGPTRILSVSPGNIGAGVMTLQTNTFATVGGVAGCGKH